jgi:cytidylate kinase
MVAIAMTREMGTLGKDVAQGIADQLDLRVVHHEVVEHDLAERLGLQESAVHRYLEGDASIIERWKIDKQKLSRYTALEILELAQQGNVVIRGWGATALLRSVPNVLRVRVCAPMAFRERVMMARLGLKDASAARREIEHSDAAHARIMQGVFGLDWKDPLLYHAVLNTDSIPVETCVRTLRQLTDDPAFQETAATRVALSDGLVAWRVRAALSERYTGGLVGSGIEATVANGRVALAGTCIQSQMKTEIEKFVRGIPGVKEIENRIIVVQGWGGL